MSAARTQQDLLQLLQQVENRERVARRRAILYTLVPILVAAILLTITGLQVYRAEKRVTDANLEVSKLEKRKSTLEQALILTNVQYGPSGNTAIDSKTKGQQENQQTPFLKQVRASSQAVAGQVTPNGALVYDFQLWVEGSTDMLARIDAVRYEFNHPTFAPATRVQESKDRSKKFAVGYRGWGCLRSVIVTFTLVHPPQGPPPQGNFDMCAALNW